MGLIYARPLRYTGLETISQYLVANYGAGAGLMQSAVSPIFVGLGVSLTVVLLGLAVPIASGKHKINLSLK